MREVLREPLVHFALIGIAIFLIFAVARDEPEYGFASSQDPASRLIVVDEAQRARLAAQFQQVWRRPPEPAELAGLVDDHVTEELLVREALALGLDGDDTVIRRRLRQKMEFILEGGATAADPSPEVLADWYAQNAASFAQAPAMAFEQVFLGETLPAPETVNDVLAALNAGASPETQGVPSLLPPNIPLSPPAAIDGAFGRDVFAVIAALPRGDWQGPVKSGYGHHLVRVHAFRPVEIPDLAAVRDAVVTAWRAEQAAAAKSERLQAIRDSYEIRVEGEPLN